MNERSPARLLAMNEANYHGIWSTDMHDDRWVDRFLFAWNKTLFYDPLDVAYTPRPDHFIAQLDADVRARFVRAGIWWMYRLNSIPPRQGWKIHVSATHHNVRQVVDTALAYLLSSDVDFKLALDINIFEMLNLKGMSRGSSGKLITVYPANDDQFRQCIDGLAHVLADEPGGYILSDMRYRDCSAVYFRYGQFHDLHEIDVMGRQLPYMEGPDGDRIADSRTPAFAIPEWAQWPFPDWEQPQPVESDGLLDGRFRVLEVIRFSNSGGVYKAHDLAEDRIVLLKEARPGTNLNPRQGYDAVDLLKREATFLSRLSDVGLFPRPLKVFQEWEHWFLAEEFIDGVDIRELLFKHNPLVRLSFDTTESQDYLRVFIGIFRGMATAVAAAHQRGIVLGDFTAANLLIQPDTFEVTVLDLEASRLITPGHADGHLESPVDLFTPGYSRSRSRGPGYVTAPADDLYGIAATMAYFVFPLVAMSYLRDDVFEVIGDFISDLGWPNEINQLLTGLAGDTITLSEALERVSDPESLIRQVQVRPRPPVEESQLCLPQVKDALASFVERSADPGGPTLFPVEPFAHVTNPLSLGYGAGGVLYALKASGRSVPAEWRQWFGERIETLNPSRYPAGLMSGLAGLAWVADTLGLAKESDHLLGVANQMTTATPDYTFYYGLAGLGMTNLRFHVQRNSPDHLAAAELCAKELCSRAQQDGDGIYWLNDFVIDKPWTGLGFGQSGPAMFLLRMYQLTGETGYLRTGEQALDWELAQGVADESSLTFSYKGTLEPYVEVGSAGIAQVLLRYGRFDAARQVLKSLAVPYTVMPGYMFGMSGIIDSLLDAADLLGDPSYRTTALQQFDYVRRTFLFNPSGQGRRTGPLGSADQLAVPGEALLRCSCDYGTGSAGVLRVVHRLHAGGHTDFLLDEIGT